MFTGLVEERGVIARIEERPVGRRLRIEARLVASDARVGDSIAVSGCCLTAIEVDETGFLVEAVPETLDRTTLGSWREGETVNLERSLRLDQRLGGHLVQGHVDGTGAVVSRTPSEHWTVVRITLPDDLDRYVVEKGSITVDGISLTVSLIGTGFFEVSLIPTTLELTTLGSKDVGDPVNLEVDLTAKYVEKLLARERRELPSEKGQP